MIEITGNTYPVKDQLKAMGGRWDAGRKAWMVPDDVAEEARRIVAAVPARAQPMGSRRKTSPSRFGRGDGGPRGNAKCYMCGSYYCEGARGGLCEDD